MNNSDLLVCEGMFEEALAASAKEKRHLTAKQAGYIAATAGGIRKMGLIHYSPRYMDRELNILLSEAKEVFKETVLCRDRDCFDISHVD